MVFSCCEFSFSHLIACFNWKKIVSWLPRQPLCQKTFSRGRILQGFNHAFLVLNVGPVQSHLTLHAAPWIQSFCVPMRLFLMADWTVWWDSKETECCCVGRSQKLHLGVRFLKIDSGFSCSSFSCTRYSARESYTPLWGACWSTEVEIAWEKPRATAGVVLLGG